MNVAAAAIVPVMLVVMLVCGCALFGIVMASLLADNFGHGLSMVRFGNRRCDYHSGKHQGEPDPYRSNETVHLHEGHLFPRVTIPAQRSLAFRLAFCKSFS